jgi:hypothetical protein
MLPPGSRILFTKTSKSLIQVEVSGLFVIERHGKV